ncbi:ribonuclease P protein component [Rhodovulum viride]|uniref:ribonuclease P protein component n=1 Tax=Rhodovulum viride TaxID=1231134 RepID=UPI003CCC5BC1
MTPPGMGGTSDMPERSETSPAVSSCLTVLSKRADFLLAARARRQSAPAFTLQARRRDEAPGGGIRVGFTCSKKVGNAVARNRAKRRLREIARAELPRHGRPGWDYVLIGRPDVTATREFEALRADLRRALDRLHADAP